MDFRGAASSLAPAINVESLFLGDFLDFLDMKNKTEARTAIRARPRAPAPIKRGLTPPRGEEDDSAAASDGLEDGVVIEMSVPVLFVLSGPGIVELEPVVELEEIGIGSILWELASGVDTSFDGDVQQMAFGLA
jgi:hypothetical protein